MFGCTEREVLATRALFLPSFRDAIMQLNVGERVVSVRREFALCSQIPANLVGPSFFVI